MRHIFANTFTLFPGLILTLCPIKTKQKMSLAPAVFQTLKDTYRHPFFLTPAPFKIEILKL